MATPAATGPRMRDRLNWAELSATALPIAARGTIVDTTAWNAGPASAVADPARNASTRTCQYSTTSVVVRMASSAAMAAPASCAPTRILRRSMRSASTPAKTDRNSVGALATAPVRPSAPAESVSPRTSQPCAVPLIHEPMLPRNAAPRKVR